MSLLPGPIVTVHWLVAHAPAVVICDVRWYLDGRPGAAAYEAAHLPSAVFVDLDRWLAGPASPDAGRHPLPDPEVFAEGMRRAGVGDGAAVVAYDDAGGMVASRLVWMLRALGEDAALLDGGLAAWTGPLEHGGEADRPVEAAPARFTARPWPPERLADAADTARAAAGGGLVLDARAHDRFRGDHEPIDPRPGHIPGAHSAPFARNLDQATGCFLPAADLRRRYDELGARPGAEVIVYCGSGVSACHDLLALEAIGVTARLYPGSWSQWSADPARPAALGDH